MLPALVRFFARRLLRSVSFPHAAPRSAAAIREILGAFEAGLHAWTRGPDAALRAAEGVAWDRREFFWEGAAAAAAALHAFRRAPGNPDAALRAIDTHRQMHFAGYGFWNGVAHAARLPPLRLDAGAWRDVPEFARYGPLVAGGAAFALAVRRGAPDARARAWPVPPNAGWREGAVHGQGRALWFLHMHDAPALCAAAARVPGDAAALLEGVGIAIAFTQIAHPEAIAAAVAAFPPEPRAIVTRGACVALVQIADDDPAAAAAARAAAAGPLRRPYERCLAAAAHAGDGPGWYLRYLDQARRLTAEA